MPEQRIDQHEIIDQAIRQVQALGNLPDLGKGGRAYLIQASLKLHEVRTRAPKHPRNPVYIEPEDRARCERGCPVD